MRSRWNVVSGTGASYGSGHTPSAPIVRIATDANSHDLQITGPRGYREVVRSPAELSTAFRERGLKVTPQRQLLFRVLHGNMTHPTAEALFATASELMPGISLRTVYQTLNDLAAMGELQQLELGTGSARFDPTVDPHHHLVCEACGRVSDLHAEFTDVRVPAGAGAGFQVSSTEVVFRGRCRECQQHHPTDPRPKEHAAHG